MKVNPTTNSMKSYFFILLLSFSSSLLIAQQKQPTNPLPRSLFAVNNRVACQLFADPSNYITGPNFSFTAPVNNNSNYSAPAGSNLGCMGSVPNQAWFIITITSPGNLYFNITNSNNRDIDAIIWGPIPNGDLNNACTVTSNSPRACDYDGGRPDLYLNNTQVGEKYLMLVTNYSNANTTIQVNQPTGGVVNYSLLNLPNCSILPSATLSGTTTSITEGDALPLTLNFTGTAPWNYRLSDGTTGSANTTPLNISVFPTAESTSYTVSSVSNICGTSSGTGTVGVSTLRNIALKSCYPLDGTASDSKSLNNGTLYNGVLATSDRNNTGNNALLFDGIDDYASFPTNQLTNTTFSMSGWVKAKTLPNSGKTETIIASIGANADNHYLSIEKIDTLNLWKFSSNGVHAYSQIKADTNWHFITGVRTGGNVKIYVDGVLENTSNINMSASHQANSQLLLGRGLNGKSFNGKIDDFKVFQGSLLDPEIILLQNSTNCGNVYDETYIAVQSLSTSVICNGTTLSLRAITNNLSIESGLQFLVELSDIKGSFANSTIIGNSTFLPVNLTIPSNTPQGTYKIRLRYGGLISLNEISIDVSNSGTYSLSGAALINDGQSANLSINFTGTGPWYYNMTQGLSGVATTSPWQITVTPDQTKTYTINSVNNVCGNLSGINSSVGIQVNFIKENISCFPFSGNVSDEKSNNTATLSGPLLTENRFGSINKAYQFNGTSDYIDFTTNNLRKREYTFSAWVLLSSIPTYDRTILSIGSIQNNTYQEIAASAQGWKFTSYGTSGRVSCVTTNFFTANQWVHITAVRSYQSLKIYVNGLLSVVTNNLSEIPFKSTDLGRIGSNVSNANSFFNGKIDDVRLYKGALNEDEVFAMFSNANDCPIVENNSIIVTRAVNPGLVCAGSDINVDFTSTNVNISPTYPILVQLSDRFGSFTSPVNIGSGTSSPITTTLPSNIVNSDFYRIRVIPTHPDPVLIINSQPVAISGSYPTATISGGGSIASGDTADLIVDFTGTSPWTYNINNGLDSTTSVTPVTISVSPSSTTTFTVTSVSNSCGTGTTSGSAEVIIPSVINLATTSLGSLCGGNQTSISFYANFTPSEGFIVQLSNAVGNFDNPLTIGSGNISPIAINIPDTMSFATGYKIRVSSFDNSVSSNPTTAFEIKRLLQASISGNSILYNHNPAVIELDFIGTPPFNYSLSTGNNGTTNLNHLEILISPGSNDTVTFNYVSNGCGLGIFSGSASVKYLYNYETATNCFPFSGNTNDAISSFNLANTNATFTLDRTGATSKALYFNGNAYLTNNNYQMYSSPDKTISFWLRPNTSFATKTRIWSIEGGSLFIKGGGTQSYTLQYHVGTPLSSEIFLPLETPELVASGLSLNTWSHIAIVKNPGYLTMYVNGVKLGELHTEYAMEESGMHIGGKSSDASKFFGMLDDFQIYAGLLDESKINILYQNGTGCDNFLTLPEIKINSADTILSCSGSDFTLNYQAINLKLSNSAMLDIELSDISGSFSNPILLHRTVSTSGEITISLPSGIISADSYKLRLKTDSYISPRILTIIVQTPLSATLTGTATISEGDLTNLDLNFSGSIPPYIFKINNGPLQTSYTSSLSLTVNPIETTNYAITSISNGCGVGSQSGNALVTVVAQNVRQISCFPFTGGSLLDAKIANTASMNGPSPTTDRNNVPNNAFYFDGQNDQITFTSNNVFQDEYSIATWFNITGVKQAAFPNDFMIFQIGKETFTTTNQHILYIYYEPDMGFGPEKFVLKYRANGITTEKLMNGVGFNQWNQITVVRSPQNIKFYLNGTLIHTATGSIANLNFASNSNIYLGNAPDDAIVDALFKGKLDDMAIYKGSLSSGQINALVTEPTDCFDASKFICLSNQQLVSNLNGNKTYQASNSITHNKSIESTSNIYFDSKNSVLLLPGFQTQSNVVFKATAGGGCVE